MDRIMAEGMGRRIARREAVRAPASNLWYPEEPKDRFMEIPAQGIVEDGYIRGIVYDSAMPLSSDFPETAQSSRPVSPILRHNSSPRRERI